MILKKCLFLAFLCVFVFAMVHIGKSEDNLGCQSSLSALFETVSRWLLPRTGWLVQEFPGILSASYLGVPRQQIHCHTNLFPGCGDPDSGPNSYIVYTLPTETPFQSLMSF